MAELNIVIPSFKRWDDLPGYEYFKNAKIVIPESQKEEYLKNRDEKRFIIIPDDEDGTVAKKRNWILRNISRPLVMIDDDVECIFMIEGGEEFKETGKQRDHIKLSSEEADDLLRQVCNLAYEWKCPIFGFNVNPDPQGYKQYKPFSLTQMILGPCQGHLEHNLIYDEKMDLKEDYDICIQALNRYKKILRVNKYAVKAGHSNTSMKAGGSSCYRTIEREESACRAIERKWGTRIIHYNLEKGKKAAYLNGIVHIPIEGV